MEGNAVRWVWNGEIFDALVEEIGRARTSVDVVLYIWRPGKASDRILAALAARAPDVACRIVVDPVGSTPAFQREVIPRLQQARCDVHVFRPLGDDAVGPSLARNHRKIVVVDGRVAFTGGFGISDEWLGDGVHERSWRDTSVRVEGPGRVSSSCPSPSTGSSRAACCSPRRRSRARSDRPARHAPPSSPAAPASEPPRRTG